MSKKNNGASNALVQGSILAVASIISRIIGLIYRIPMQRILGDIGIGYYSTAFEIYMSCLLYHHTAYHLPYQRWFQPRWQKRGGLRRIRY